MAYKHAQTGGIPRTFWFPEFLFCNYTAHLLGLGWKKSNFSTDGVNIDWVTPLRFSADWAVIITAVKDISEYAWFPYVSPGSCAFSSVWRLVLYWFSCFSQALLPLYKLTVRFYSCAHHPDFALLLYIYLATWIYLLHCSFQNFTLLTPLGLTTYLQTSKVSPICSAIWVSFTFRLFF